MNCTTCQDTKTVLVDGQTCNCPDCSPVHQASGPNVPSPTSLVLHCTSIAVQPSPDDTLGLFLNGIDLDEVLGQIPVEVVMKYYSPGDILGAMHMKDIKAHLNEFDMDIKTIE